MDTTEVERIVQNLWSNLGTFLLHHEQLPFWI